MKNIESSRGALPAQNLSVLAENRFIIGLKKDNIKPASIDLSISGEIYEVKNSFQVPENKTVWETINEVGYIKHSIDKPIRVNRTYVAKLNESLDLPQNVYGYANPKSTSGRLDLHVRLLADCISPYDSIYRKGWKGDLWVLIKPKSFNIKLYPNISLNQLRLCYSDTRIGGFELESLMQSPGVLFDPNTNNRIGLKEMQAKDNQRSVILTIDAISTDIPLGYVANNDKDLVIDIKSTYKTEDFFKTVESKNNMIILQVGKFYILSSYEHVVVPVGYASEMASIDDRFGEFRSHYAGFIDPGWGVGEDGKGFGRPLTLEVRAFESMVVRHRQPIARLKYEHLAEIPNIHYDSIPSNYTRQIKAKLAKQFI